MKKALIIVDVQQMISEAIDHSDFVDWFGFINSKAKTFSHAGDLVIFSRQELPNQLFFRKVFGKNMVKGSSGVENSEHFEAFNSVDYIKYFPSALSNKKLLSFLKSNQITDLTIIGGDGVKCAYYTALDASQKGFDVTYDYNGIFTFWPNQISEKVTKLQNAGVQIAGNSENMLILDISYLKGKVGGK